jgi:hypothetical protein
MIRLPQMTSRDFVLILSFRTHHERLAMPLELASASLRDPQHSAAKLFCNRQERDAAHFIEFLSSVAWRVCDEPARLDTIDRPE